MSPLDDDDDDNDAAPARRGIQSATIGFRVLNALAAEPAPATLTAIARGAQLSASQAHRYLASLVQSGLARQDAASGLYDLGPQAISIGLAALARTDIFALADPALAAFARATGRTIALTARGPLGPTIVRWHSGRIPVISSLAIGSVFPYLRSATGRVFLSFLNDDVAAELVARELALEQSPDQLDVAQIRAQIRADMYAIVDETLIPGLRAVAAPILDIQGQPALVATAIATNTFDRRDDDRIRAHLITLCRSLTENVGGQWR